MILTLTFYLFFVHLPRIFKKIPVFLYNRFRWKDLRVPQFSWPFYQLFHPLARRRDMKERIWMQDGREFKERMRQLLAQWKWMPISFLINIHLHPDISIIFLFPFSIFFDRIDLTYVPGGPYLLYLDSCWTLVPRWSSPDINFTSLITFSSLWYFFISVTRFPITISGRWIKLLWIFFQIKIINYFCLIDYSFSFICWHYNNTHIWICQH